MKISEIALSGAFVIDIEPIADSRGFFARTYCSKEFEAHGIKPQVAQCNLSLTLKKGTVRGLHYQKEPAAETKLIRCTAGAIYDVIVDLRSDSPTFLEHIGIELSGENRRALYVPTGFAHGFQTLVDSSEVVYQMGEFYAPGYAAGLRYSDPALSIQWPLSVTELSKRDRAWPLWPST